ncbi:DEAD/DEAH box helicase [Austwickia chelonae]|uniref:DEAD/DEAH box helicase n=1 Tax=Austwickia chelonae TaxID=100225 RepID=UPI000E27B944|nr:AAA domain-containing protein [Austwickia chelonae]
MRGERSEDERIRILKFWWMLELFSPQKIPALTRKATQPSDHQVCIWQPEDPLPWESLAPPDPVGSTTRVWRHTVYLGVYQLKATYEALSQVFAEDPDAYDQSPDGQSACAGLVIAQDGRLVPDSVVLSSALWAAGRTRSPGPENPHWMEGFGQAQAQLTKEVDDSEGERRQEDGGEQPPPHNRASMLELLRIAHGVAGVTDFDDLASNSVIIDSVAVSERRALDGATTDFLNSFYLDDLKAVREHVTRGNLGAALSSYLTGDSSLPVAERIDIVAHPDIIDAATSVERLPKGRWPSSPQHSLALSQQYAVNRALGDLAPSSGIMGVNGPPGTGKTTMLRDILAGNVVERARRLAALATPADAFTKVTHRWSDAAGHSRAVPQLRPELTGFEMVVASANNAAVENVTAEIPAHNAIADPWRGNIDYFGDIATKVLQACADKEDASSSDSPPSAWGLVAARLGRKRNRTAFQSAFWFDEKTPRNRSVPQDNVPRMQTTLTRWRDGDAEYTPWAQAKADFRAAERRVDRLISERAQAQERLRRHPLLTNRERSLHKVADQARRHLEKSNQALTRHLAVEQSNEAALDLATANHERHLAAKPGVLETIFSLGRAVRDWREQLDTLTTELDLAARQQQETLEHGRRIRQTLQESQDRMASVQSVLDHTQQEQAQLSTACAHDQARFGKAYPGSKGDQRELRAPWLDEELDSARSDLFVAALTLHQRFLANAAHDMLHGLRAAMDVVAGHHPHDLAPQKILAAWQLFFLTVPLISTTFASAGRMFDGLGQESIGWLLIDEAGQSSPQYAVGSIWRARRVIAVGDPLQIEPVVTLPKKAQRNIALSYGIGSTWIPPRASVQTLADRVSRFGTVLDQGEEKVWVSAPLRVHRRCDDPMFTLCNRIAYNDLMISGVHRTVDDPAHPDRFDGPDGPIIAVSHWADEPASARGSHLQPNQILRFKKALNYLAGQDVPPSDVIAISPFCAMADRLHGLTTEYRGLRAGTIHTAQGREAPVVILVLGGDPDKPGAAVNWARTPNLVNVAASRVQRRLYVIGDRAFWSRHNYFRDLARALGR